MDIYSFSGPKIWQIVKFELVSWWGRTFFRYKSKIKKNGIILLDIGAGTNYLENWTHVDFFLVPRIKFWKKYFPRKTPEVQMDLRYPFNCKDNIVDGIYTSHALEHLYPNDACRLLKEMYRILKHGSWLRIIVPDLKICVDFYNGKSIPEFKFNFKAEAISNYTQNWGHHSAWDEELLSKVLGIIGFINIRKVKFGEEGTDKRLIKEEEVRKFESLVLEAQKA
jgi:predicted SAM-dependent methyltransferase